jgi:nucleoside-diphosphate-sugar epimerase
MWSASRKSQKPRWTGEGHCNREMKVLVTGANGFVGRSLCPVLSARGCEVVPVVRKSFGFANEVIFGDANETSDWRYILQGCETVVHLMGQTHVKHESNHDSIASYRAANVGITSALARQATEMGAKRFVFISSVKVNGETTLPGQVFTEQDDPTPLDAYGQSKLEAERALREIAEKSEMNVVYIRPPLVYGYGVKGNFSALLRLVGKGIPLPLGAVENSRSLVALINLVDFIALCVDWKRSPQAANEVFLISDGEDISTTELILRIAHAYGVTPRLLSIPSAWLRLVARCLGKGSQADRLLDSLAVDSSKSRDLLGWRPVVTMEEQLKIMADHVANL